MKILSSFIIFGISICTLTSCKKDKTPAVNKTQLLTTGKWRLVSYTSTNNATGAVTDYYTSLPACSKDNELSFAANGVNEYNEGATKCNPADPQVIYIATWKFITNETVIEVVSGTSRLEYKILNLTENELYMEIANGTVTERVRLIH